MLRAFSSETSAFTRSAIGEWRLLGPSTDGTEIPGRKHRSSSRDAGGRRPPAATWIERNPETRAICIFHSCFWVPLDPCRASRGPPDLASNSGFILCSTPRRSLHEIGSAVSASSFAWPMWQTDLLASQRLRVTVSTSCRSCRSCNLRVGSWTLGVEGA
jgi:hypothetical protein